jgi:arsenate reductase
MDSLKKVLVMCTGNSCRSIIGEALINAKLDNIQAYSCGVKPSGKVNKNAQKILEQNNIWDKNYTSKHLDDIIDIDFDLVVTVCDNAYETCPIFPKKTKVIHISFEDPDGKEFIEFKKIYKQIEEILLPQIIKNLRE